jgi:hypothetical protein
VVGSHKRVTGDCWEVLGSRIRVMGSHGELQWSGRTHKRVVGSQMGVVESHSGVVGSGVSVKGECWGVTGGSQG